MFPEYAGNGMVEWEKKRENEKYFENQHGENTVGFPPTSYKGDNAPTKDVLLQQDNIHGDSGPEDPRKERQARKSSKPACLVRATYFTVN